MSLAEKNHDGGKATIGRVRRFALMRKGWCATDKERLARRLIRLGKNKEKRADTALGVSS